MTYNKILIAVDASEYSMNAAKKGFEFAHQLDAEVALLFVLDTSKAMGNVDAGISREQAMIVLKKEAEQTLDQLAQMYNGKQVIKLMPEGHPAEEILKTAGIWEADLIVAGTHGRTGFLRVIMGSVAEHLVRLSTIPVMIIPSK